MYFFKWIYFWAVLNISFAFGGKRYIGNNFSDLSTGVEVHFDNKDGGFFLKHAQKPYFQPIPDLSSVLPSSTTPSSVLSIDRFTVFQSSQPISVRATYGPFSTKQTVPARYIVPDPLDSLTPIPISLPIDYGKNVSIPVSTGVEFQELVSHHLDMSAHIVRAEIPRDSPVLRVLFHTGSDPGGRRQLLFTRHQRVCIVLHAHTAGKTPLSAACSPDGEDGVCLAQVIIPSNWWPPLPPPNKHGQSGKPVKSPPRLVQVSYSVLEPLPTDGEDCMPRIQIQPVTVLGFVPLVPAKAGYKELRIADTITISVPHPPLFPLSKFHIPVFMERGRSKEITAVVIRARVKGGLRILSATSSTQQWNITVEINSRHTSACVTVLRREPQEPEQENSAEEVTELFVWLMEVTEGAEELYEGVKIVWSARFEPHEPGINPENAGSDSVNIPSIENRKPITKLEVQKDDIQSVVPISKNWEVMNTAVLTGRQVSQAMKVFIVSQAGKAADVTLQSSCHSEDESVLKVSSSCTSVYVDGSEARGSVNGSVLVKYATYTGLARFTVWMPEFPLDLTVSDVRLSQIKSWKVSDYHTNTAKLKRKRRSLGIWGHNGLRDDLINGVNIEKPLCRLRYQQTTVDVYAHFLANDHDSGRISYFVNRRTWLRVTDLVLPLLRVSDPRIASLDGRILQGRSMGRTEVQVISPITGRVTGAKEIRVGNDKISITKLSVRVVSGLQLNISPDSSIENGYIAETSVTRKLTAQYQEGLLDIEIEFSDGTKAPLRDIANSEYNLIVKSLDTEVVAFAPMVASHHPRVIAVGEGSGNLLQISLFINEDCRALSTRSKLNGKNFGLLATAAAAVEVDFSVTEISHRPDFVQNDGGIPLKDETNHEPSTQVLHRSSHSGVLINYERGIVTKYQTPATTTPLEIAMYILLTGFCFAILVFVVSCVVYASKFKPRGLVTQPRGGIVPSDVCKLDTGIGKSQGTAESKKTRDSTTNAQDWVWLGRATLEKKSFNESRINNRTSNINNNNSLNEIHITANPINLNYSVPEDCIFEKRNLHQDRQPLRSFDSTTYSKKEKSTIHHQNKEVHDFSKYEDDAENWRKRSPPAVPPHVSSLKMDEDYKPPVPPHRNIEVKLVAENLSNNFAPLIPPIRDYNHRHYSDINHELLDKSSDHCFEFDVNRSLQNCDNEMFQLSEEKSKSLSFKSEQTTESEKDFIEITKNGNEKLRGNGSNKLEIKRATIIENPMFSGALETNSISADVHQTYANGASLADLSSLDGFQLDMNYEEIMQYFNNLKESNA